MKVMRMILAVLMAWVTTGTMAQEVGVKFIDNKPLYEVIQMARQQGKLVFVDCYTTWCGPCKMMANSEFVKKEAEEYFNDKFVCAKYDMEKGDGPDMASRYQVRAYPTFLILNEEGEMVHRVVGASTLPDFIKKIDEGLQGKTLAEYRKEFSAGECSEAFLREYIQVLDDKYLEDEAMKVARQLIEGKSAETIVDDLELFMAYAAHYQPQVSDELFQQVCQHRTTIREHYGPYREELLKMHWLNAMKECRDGDKADEAKVAEIKRMMAGCGFGDVSGRCEESLRKELAYDALHNAFEAKDGKALLKALKGFEKFRVRAFYSEDSLMIRMTEEYNYLNYLEKLARMQTGKKYVVKQAKERIKLFEYSKQFIGMRTNFGDDKHQTIAEYAISRYQKARDIAEGKEPAQEPEKPQSVPATLLRVQ